MARRRSGASSFAALVIAVFALAGLAAFSIYVVATAAVALAVAFGGWLAKKSAEHQARPPPAKLPEPLAPLEAPLPRHVQLLPVDPVVFDDLVTTEAEALKVFSVWARQHPGAPHDPTRFVQSTEVGFRFLGRLTSEIEHTTLTWRERTYNGPEAPGREPEASFDELARLSDSALCARTRHITECTNCRASGQVLCTSCRGTLEVTCGTCQGSGKAYGISKNGSRRLMNCTACDKTGKLGCTACSNGRVACSFCKGSGKRERYLEAARRIRRDIQLEPDGNVTAAFSWGEDGSDVTPETIGADGRIHASISAMGPLSPDALKAVAGESWLAANGAHLVPKLAEGERVVQQSFQFIEIPAVAVTWALPAHDPEVTTFEGLRLLAPPLLADASAFLKRVEEQKRATLVLASLPVLVLLAYAWRGLYFLRADIALVLLLIAAAAGGAAWALRRSSEREDRPWLPAFGAVPALALAGLLAIRAEPTEADVDALLKNQDLVHAEHALAALGSADAPEHVALRRRVDLLRVMAAKNSNDAAEKLALVPPETAERLEGERHVDLLLLDEAKKALASHDLQLAEARAGKVLHAKEGAADILKDVRSAEARDCLRAGDFKCAINKATEAQDDALRQAAVDTARARVLQAQDSVRALPGSDLKARLTSTTDVVAWLEAIAIADPTVTPDIRRAKDDAEKLTAKIAEADRRLREAEERERAREARRREEEARREAARQEQLRREANRPRPVRCCDGSTSPGCYYGGSLRGCCSHHGGVC